MEISTAPAVRPLAVEEGRQETAAAVQSIPTAYPSDADDSEIKEAAQTQAKEIKKAVKGKGKSRGQKKHGVMSLPAEIRERYAFQSTVATRTIFSTSSSTLITDYCT